MLRTYREFLDSREGFPKYTPTREDWQEYEVWLESVERRQEAERELIEFANEAQEQIALDELEAHILERGHYSG